MSVATRLAAMGNQKPMLCPTENMEASSQARHHLGIGEEGACLEKGEIAQTHSLDTQFILKPLDIDLEKTVTKWNIKLHLIPC